MADNRACVLSPEEVAAAPTGGQAGAATAAPLALPSGAEITEQTGTAGVAIPLREIPRPERAPDGRRVEISAQRLPHFQFKYGSPETATVVYRIWSDVPNDFDGAVFGVGHRVPDYTASAADVARADQAESDARRRATAAAREEATPQQAAVPPPPSTLPPRRPGGSGRDATASACRDAAPAAERKRHLDRRVLALGRRAMAVAGRSLAGAARGRRARPHRPRPGAAPPTARRAAARNAAVATGGVRARLLDVGRARVRVGRRGVAGRA